MRKRSSFTASHEGSNRKEKKSAFNSDEIKQFDIKTEKKKGNKFWKDTDPND